MANFSVEQIAAANKASLGAFQSVINSSLNNLEKLASHSFSSTRNALQGHIDSAHKLLDAKDLQQAITIHSSNTQPQFETSINYYRGIYDISSTAREEYLRLLEQGYEELNKSLTATLDWYSKTSGNADLAVGAVKSAFENAKNAARQVAEITEASVSAATKATSRAVEISTSNRRKSA